MKMHTEYVIKRTERGWASHFICADRCLFRRSTTVEYNGLMVLISTVGRMLSADSKHYERIGCNRYYETMCWLADPTDEYHDASTALKEIVITGNSALDDVNDEWGANNMHEAIVAEMTTKLINNSLEYYED